MRSRKAVRCINRFTWAGEMMWTLRHAQHLNSNTKLHRRTKMLINKSKVKAFTLEMAKGRHHKITRVGGDFYIKCEGQLKEFIRNYVYRLPSKGKTIQ